LRVSLLILMFVGGNAFAATEYPGIDPVRLGYGDTSAFHSLLESSDGSAIIVISDGVQTPRNALTTNKMRAAMAQSLSGPPGLPDAEVKHLVPLTSPDLARSVDPEPLRTSALQEVMTQMMPAEVITARPVSKVARRETPRLLHTARRHRAHSRISGPHGPRLQSREVSI
jgi:hypothetical protein